ncbi:MAG: FHA domain-containing protein [Gloeomargarita sp. SKYG116]|nr:FHA domain-containing protein [Gloeomargarita sp. SKYG116]MCS7225972.1 FHA domain-containing protein [Gloeomargarita sp. SKYB31]MDW8400120.1 FHA domain-containing protein [Gloeomargarita sp. SKYGB_i_bin116]
MSDTPRERHLLIIQDDDGPRAIALEAATYSLGRDPSNAIVLKSKTVSRRHAILLRLPNPETKGYRYRLMDGDAQGNRSANGTRVNNKEWTSGELKDGDLISFGDVQARYSITYMTDEEFKKHTEAIDFRSIKSATVNTEETQMF